MGITDNDVAVQALEASGGDIQAALEIIFGENLFPQWNYEIFVICENIIIIRKLFFTLVPQQLGCIVEKLQYFSNLHFIQLCANIYDSGVADTIFNP